MCWCIEGTWRALEELRKVGRKQHTFRMAGAEIRRGTATWGQKKQGVHAGGVGTAQTGLDSHAAGVGAYPC